MKKSRNGGIGPGRIVCLRAVGVPPLKPPTWPPERHHVLVQGFAEMSGST